MLSENIILQSARSLSVAVLALLMVILQALFFFRKPEFTWYAWSSAISFSALLYSLGIFLEYNTPEGPLNRFSGLLEYTAIIFLVHSLYGFTFSYLGIESKRYHPVAGVCHGLILILLWFTNYIVAESFTTRNFIGLEFPYIEPALGPLGPLFVLYAAIAGVNAMIIWIKHKRTDPKHRITYLAGIGFWLLLGIHDALASLGVPTFQYVMEYGFLGFAMVVLWVVFNNYLEIAAVEKYRVMTEFANGCILVIQDGKMVLGNPACCDLIGWPLTDSEPIDFLDIMASEDRKTVLENYNTLLEGGRVPNPHTVRIRRTDGEQRFVEITTSVIRYGNRPAVLAVMRDMEEALREIENKYHTLVDRMNDGLAVFDSTDLNTFVNDKFCQMLGYSRYEFSGHPASDFLDEANQSILEEHIARRRKGESDPYELEWTHKNGQKVFTLVSPTLILDADGRYAGAFAVITDITERKQAEEALRCSNEEVLKEHNQRKMLSKRLIDLLEKDRRQIAMELHDHIGQTLTSIKMNLEMIHGKLKPGLTELGDQITVAKERTIQAIKDVKNVSHGLRPAMIDALGVVSSLRELFNEIQQQTDIEIHFFSRGIPERFEEEKELAIYRISQEALVNIIRHARAKHVFVNLVKKDENLSLSVEDDGVGFDKDRAMQPSKKKGSLGLLIMRERAIQLDGELTIESQIGKGTHLLVEIPL